MEKVIYLYLSFEVVDDGNYFKDDVDDLVIIFELMIYVLDIVSFIFNFVVDNSDYKVVINNVSYKLVMVQLININGGFHLYVSIKILKVNVKVIGKCFICFNVSGKFIIDEIVIVIDLMIFVKNGKVVVVMKNIDVQLLGFDVDVNGILGLLFDFIVDVVVNGFKSSFIKEFKKELGN